MQAYDERIKRLESSGDYLLWQDIRRGLEKESLRITREGKLAQTGHPTTLGSALTHPYITTDYAEAQLEFTTPAREELGQALRWLDDIHRFVHSALPDELLWPYSMPPAVDKEQDIAVARYGSSHRGQMRTVYRQGLGHRYGRHMQLVSGVHYNVSLPYTFWRRYQDLLGDTQPLQAFISEQYFALLRNYHRYSWLILYLFGASPVADDSFVVARSTYLGEQATPLALLNDHVWYAPEATSLRMSDWGYHNSTRARLQLSFNHINDYLDGLEAAIRTPDPAWQAIGVNNPDGSYRQLSANTLQIENEYYAGIRPKRITCCGERPSRALRRAGVEYVEVRSLDLDPFADNAVAESTLAFLDIFLLYCLLQPSAPLDAKTQQEASYNSHQVAVQGRKPGLALHHEGRAYPLQHWGNDLLDAMVPLATLLDRSYLCDEFSLSLQEQRAKLAAPDATPSARVLQALSQRPLLEWGLDLATKQHQRFVKRPLYHERLAEFQAKTLSSLAEQRALESQDQESFDEFLVRYFA